VDPHKGSVLEITVVEDHTFQRLAFHEERSTAAISKEHILKNVSGSLSGRIQERSRLKDSPRHVAVHELATLPSTIDKSTPTHFAILEADKGKRS
jgi:hypothetical protein